MTSPTARVTGPDAVVVSGVLFILLLLHYDVLQPQQPSASDGSQLSDGNACRRASLSGWPWACACQWVHQRCIPRRPLSLSMHDTMVFPAHPNLPQHARAKFQKVELRHYAESLYLRLRCEERCLPIAAVADWKHQGGCWESGEI